jgi:hypothetical protein
MPSGIEIEVVRISMPYVAGFSVAARVDVAAAKNISKNSVIRMTKSVFSKLNRR